MNTVPVGQAVLQKVVAKLGGVSAAAAQLGIAARLITRYLDSTAPVPDEILLRAVDIMLRDSPSILKPSPTYLRSA